MQIFLKFFGFGPFKFVINIKITEIIMKKIAVFIIFISTLMEFSSAS